MNLLHLITPTNLAEEEEKFFGSTSYHPQFRYDWSQELQQDTDFVSAVLNQDYNQITSLAETLFSVPWSTELLQQAQLMIVNNPEEIPHPTLEELVLAQQNALDELGIPYAVVVSDEKGFVARPQHAKKQLVISRDIHFHFFSLQSSVRHDMSHIVRYLNGEHNQIVRSENYLPTEEGLASFMQDYGGHEPNHSRFQHAAEYAVTDVCRNGSLRDAVEYLVSIGFPTKLAWQRAVRHKFGFMNTARPGDIMKPAMYFAYEQQIKQLSDDEQFRLFVGKISLSDLPMYPAYTGRWSKEELKAFFDI